MTNQCTKFEVFGLSHSRDILKEVKNLNGSHDVTTHLSETIGGAYQGLGGAKPPQIFDCLLCFYCHNGLSPELKIRLFMYYSSFMAITHKLLLPDAMF